MVLIGRWDWWPSRLSHEDRDHGTLVPGPEWAVRPPTRGRADGRVQLRTEYGDAGVASRPKPSERPTVVLLVRHGTTPTTGKVLPGRAPGLHLAERGPGPGRGGGRADRRPRRHGEHGAPVAVYASPLERTTETARPIARALGLRVRSDRGLLECDFGEWTGKKLADLAKKPEWTTVQRNPSGFRFPGGESFLEMQTRMSSALARLVAQHPGRDDRGRVPRRSDQGGARLGARDPPRPVPADLRRALLGISVVAYGPGGPAVLGANSTEVPPGITPAPGGAASGQPARRARKGRDMSGGFERAPPAGHRRHGRPRRRAALGLAGSETARPCSR